MAFVDYEKAFDSIKHWALFHALHRCHIDSRYVDVPRELYRSATLQHHLSHLRFADDLVLFASFDDLQRMLEQLYDASLRVGLRMNMSKTVGNERLERVDQYVCLGHVLSFGKEHQPKEISKRIQLGWAAFSKLGDILKSDHWMKNHPGQRMTIYDLPELVKEAISVATNNIIQGFASTASVTDQANKELILGQFDQ
ncbi:uncharacterized protein LOC113226370 [Hyposmocoma kahamanoa]|uniref:uncharacterized protein LOC113226370 n=1 Tax=Hyposmocoma kahamanoa TaxID=1477025 RepID=UPI000E6D7B25|nr:uncharacterized protein LOC113226370 [Hyposmocoma kahamanoa]